MDTKKIAFSLGGFLTVTAPIVAVISCGNNLPEPSQTGETSRNISEEKAKEFNNKCKSQITKVNKKVIDLPLVNSKTAVTAEQLFIKDQMDRIGWVESNSRQSLFVTARSLNSITITSIITYDDGTVNQGTTAIEIKIATKKLEIADIFTYNKQKIETNKYLTKNNSTKVKDLPAINEDITIDQLGIQSFHFEGVDQVKTIVKVKNHQENQLTSGTITVDIIFSITQDKKILSEPNTIIVYGFAESEYVKNKADVEKAIKILNPTDGFEYDGIETVIGHNDLLDKNKIIKYPKEEIEKLGVSVEFKYSKENGNHVELGLSKGTKEFQTYTPKPQTVFVKFYPELTVLDSVAAKVEEAVNKGSKWWFDQIKELIATLNSEGYEPHPITKETFATALGITLEIEDYNEKNVEFILKKGVENIKKDSATFKLTLILGQVKKDMTFTLDKFVDRDQKASEIIKEDLQKITSSIYQRASFIAIKQKIQEDEKILIQNVEKLNKILGINYKEPKMLDPSKKVLYSITAFKEDEHKNYILTMSTSLGWVQKDDITIIFKSFDASDAVVSAKKQIAEKLKNLSQTKSELTFEALDSKSLPYKNINASGFKDILGLTFNDSDILTTVNRKASYDIKKVDSNVTAKTVTFNIMIYVGEADLLAVTITLNAADQTLS